jgi:hypothetical protein
VSTSNSALENRVSALERQVDELREQLQIQTDPAKRKTNMDKVIGFFGDDPVMKRIFRNAEKFREDDRKKVRRKQPKTRRTKS